MKNTIIEAIKNIRGIKPDSGYMEEKIAEALKMFEAGWDAMEDGRVVSYKGDYVVVKKGDTLEVLKMKDFNIQWGIMDGNIDSIYKTIKVTEDKKESYLAQAVIAKYYTMRKA